MSEQRHRELLGELAQLKDGVIELKQRAINAEAQLLTQAEEIRRLREALVQVGELASIDGVFTANLEDFLSAVLGTPTPTTWGQKALDVVEAALARHRFKPGFDLFKLDVPLDEACEALSELQKERTP